MAPNLPRGRDPKRIGDYVLLSRLPYEGEEQVYMALGLKPRRRALVKHAPRQSPHFTALRQRLLEEAKEQLYFQYDKLAQIHELIEQDDGAYLVLEQIEGADLRTAQALLTSRGRGLSFELAAYIAREVLLGLHHLHTLVDSSGARYCVVITDLDPRRVLLSSGGEVRLANRALAALLRSADRGQELQALGYVPPECLDREPFGILSNVYAVGVMLFELLMGRAPFQESSREALTQRIRTKGVPVGELEQEGIPEALATVVARATQIVPERRYLSALDMAEALDSYLRDSGTDDPRKLLAGFLGLLQSTEPRPEALGIDIEAPVEIPEVDELALAVTQPALADGAAEAPDRALIPWTDRAPVARDTTGRADSMALVPAAAGVEGALAVRALERALAGSMPPAAFPDIFRERGPALPITPGGDGRRERWLVLLICLLAAAAILVILATGQQKTFSKLINRDHPEQEVEDFRENFELDRDEVAPRR